MKYQIASAFVLVALIAVGSVSAQDKRPNFSGTWIYDESKSDKAMKELFKSKKPPISTKRTSRTLVIEHSGIELRVKETVLVEVLDETGKVSEGTETRLPVYTYYTDKRGEQNVDASGKTLKSVTRFDKKQIRVSIADEKDYRHSTITFSLSKDGQGLKVVWVSISADNGHISYTGFGDRVYNRAK